MCRFFSEYLLDLLVFMCFYSSIIFHLSLGRRAALSASGKLIRIVWAKPITSWLLELLKLFSYVVFNTCLLMLSGLDESILEECLQHLEKQLESSQARKAMEEFFSERWSQPQSCSPRTSFHFLFLLACHCQHLSDVNASPHSGESCKMVVLSKHDKEVLERHWSARQLQNPKFSQCFLGAIGW